MRLASIAFIAAASIAACIQTASAADMAAKAPPPAMVATPVPTWTGCYIGADVGYGWGQSQHDFSNAAPTDISRPRGMLGGGLAGCNYQMNNVLLGLEADYEGANLEGGGFDNLTGSTSSGAVKITSDSSARIRAGVIVWNNSLLYLTGGFALAHYSATGGPGVLGLGAPLFCCSFSSSPYGSTLGGGWEYAFAPNWTARVEYRHTQYSATTGPLNPFFPAVNMTVQHNIVDAVRFAITYKFTALFAHQ